MITPDDDLRRLREAENGRTDERPPIGEQTTGETGDRRAYGEGGELIGAGIVSQQFGAPLVLANADHDAAETAGEQKPQAEIGEQQRASRQIEHALQIDRRSCIARHVERGYAGYAVEPSELRRSDMKFRPRRRIDGVEQDQRHRQRDHAEIDVADASVENEIAEQRRKARGNRDRQQQGQGAFSEVEHGDRISVGAEPEERRLSETQDAAIAPYQREAERQDRHHEIDGQVQDRVEIGQARRHYHDRQAQAGDDDEPEDVGQTGVHRLLRKNRPVTPCGRMRIRTMAAASNATSPNTGVVA